MSRLPISTKDQGDPIVLVHGFASTKEVNWVSTGWVTTLTRAGRRVIALDNRGHGQSSKLYDPADYHTDKMADDVRALLDHLEHRARRRHGLFDGRAHHGLSHASRIRSACARRCSAGSASGWSSGVGLPESIADALEAPSLDDVTDPQGRMFRAFAEQTKSDLRGARRLHPRLAPGAEPRAGGRSSVSRYWSRSAPRTTSPARRRSSPRSFRAPRRSISRTATTCWRSATRSTRPGFWTSLTSALSPAPGVQS